MERATRDGRRQSRNKILFTVLPCSHYSTCPRITFDTAPMHANVLSRLSIYFVCGTVVGRVQIEQAAAAAVGSLLRQLISRRTPSPLLLRTALTYPSPWSACIPVCQSVCSSFFVSLSSLAVNNTLTIRFRRLVNVPFCFRFLPVYSQIRPRIYRREHLSESMNPR